MHVNSNVQLINNVFFSVCRRCVTIYMLINTVAGDCQRPVSCPAIDWIVFTHFIISEINYPKFQARRLSVILTQLNMYALWYNCVIQWWEDSTLTATNNWKWMTTYKNQPIAVIKRKVTCWIVWAHRHLYQFHVFFKVDMTGVNNYMYLYYLYIMYLLHICIFSNLLPKRFFAAGATSFPRIFYYVLNLSVLTIKF